MTVIYALRCPITNDVRYIGKTKYEDKRLAAHIAAARGRHVNHHCANWIRSLLAQGLTPLFEILCELSDQDDWREAERRYIAQFRASGHRLTNSTSGGDGFHDMPADVVAKGRIAMAASIKKRWAENPEFRERRRIGRIKALSAPEVREKMSRSAIEAAIRPGVREKNSTAQKAAWAGKDAKALAKLSDKTSASMLALWSDPGVRATRLATLHTPEAKAKRYSNRDTPEKTAERIAKLKAAWSDPDRRARRIAQMQTPEAMAKRVAAARQMWARRKAAKQPAP